MERLAARRAPDWLWPLVPITAIAAPASLLAYFGFRIYCIAMTQKNGHFSLGLAYFFLVIEFFVLGESAREYSGYQANYISSYHFDVCHAHAHLEET